LILVCSPNNPTDRWSAVMSRSPPERVPGDVPVVLDEAYREFVRDPTRPTESSSTGRRTSVLRTFRASLAGLRRFAIARAVADALRKTAVLPGVRRRPTGRHRVPASGGGPAERVEAIVAERSRVRERLLALGWSVPSRRRTSSGWPSARHRRVRAQATTLHRGPRLPGRDAATVAEQEAEMLLSRRWRAGAARMQSGGTQGRANPQTSFPLTTKRCLSAIARGAYRAQSPCRHRHRPVPSTRRR
jgi:hypothetical protein